MNTLAIVQVCRDERKVEGGRDEAKTRQSGGRDEGRKKAGRVPFAEQKGESASRSSVRARSVT